MAKKKEVKTSMARLLAFEYQYNPDIFQATGGDPRLMMERAMLCAKRGQEPGYALYDAIERGWMDGKTLLALATIAFVKIIQDARFGMIAIDMANLDKPFEPHELEALRHMPEEDIEKLPPPVRDKIRRELDGE